MIILVMMIMIMMMFRKSVEFCSESDIWKLNVAHVLFMQVMMMILMMMIMMMMMMMITRLGVDRVKPWN